MPEVNVQLSGKYDLGYVVVVSPWQVVVSKRGDRNITWKGTHPLRITHAVDGNFDVAGDNQYREIHHSGPVRDGAIERNYHYEISILADGGHFITIDPDYRIEP